LFFQEHPPISYDWPLCIDVQKKALLRVLAGIAERLGESEAVARMVLAGLFAALRPAEAAARRLIAIAAHGLVVETVEKRAAPSAPIPKGSGSGGRVPCFALFDPRRRIGTKRRKASGGDANIWFMDGLDVRRDRAAPPSPDDMLATARLRRRLAAVLHALHDIPKQARRLARRYARQDRPIRPMRPGRPPGFRAGGTREIDDILADCHELALIALAEPGFGEG
jgi:hypothetical protein